MGTSYSDALHYVRFTNFAARLAKEAADTKFYTGRYDNKKHRRSFKVKRSRIKYFNKEV